MKNSVSARARIQIVKMFLHVSFLILQAFSRHGQFIKDFLDDDFAGFFLGLGLVGDGHAVTQHVMPMLFTSWGVT